MYVGAYLLLINVERNETKMSLRGFKPMPHENILVALSSAPGVPPHAHLSALIEEPLKREKLVRPSNRNRNHGPVQLLLHVKCALKKTNT